jgi:hypothetical protein
VVQGASFPDEKTALEVHGHHLLVLGDGLLQVVDPHAHAPAPIKLHANERHDLLNLRVEPAEGRP